MVIQSSVELNISVGGISVSTVERRVGMNVLIELGKYGRRFAGARMEDNPAIREKGGVITEKG